MNLVKEGKGSIYKVYYVEHLAKYFMELSKWKFEKLYKHPLRLTFFVITIAIAVCYYPTFRHFSKSVHGGNRTHWMSAYLLTIYIGACYLFMFMFFYTLVLSLYIKWSCLQYVVDLIPIDDETYEKTKDHKKPA